MRNINLKQDKGVAGLTVLLSLVVSLFIIGLLVMIFSLMGGEIMDTSTVSAGNSNTATDTGITPLSNNTAITLTSCNKANQGKISSITTVYNTTDNMLMASGNYSISGDCGLILTTAGDLLYNSSTVNVTYGYTYAGDSWTVMNDTVSGIGSSVNWFDIFIVLGAMVVLILLTVIIIVAIRGSGLMGGSDGEGQGQNIGSA